MIPMTTSDLDSLAAEVERQGVEVQDLLAGLTPEALRWRVNPKKWSVAGHVAHMVLVNGPYLDALAPCAREARSRGLTADGPYRHPLFARWFVSSMEPPPKMRLPTLKAMVPDPSADGVDALQAFLDLQQRTADLIESTRGLDLGKARFRSPFSSLVKLSLGTGIELLLAHNRRHVWLMREVMEQPGFPSA